MIKSKRKRVKQLRLQKRRTRRTLKERSKNKYLKRKNYLGNRYGNIIYQPNNNYSEVEIDVPINFSFLDNTDEILKFLRECKKLLHKNVTVKCNLSNISSLSSDAIAVLAACANDDSFLGEGKIRGNAPKDPDLKKLFVESGFYDHVISSPNLKKISRQEDILFHKENSIKVQSDIAKKACLLGTTHVFGNKYPFPPLYEMLIEAMSNTNNHASSKKGEKINWWLYTFNAPNGHTMYTFIDLGVGIFDSLPVIMFKKLKNLVGIGHNVDIVGDLLDGKIKSREKIDNKIRGKGIPQIAANSCDSKFIRAYIISNDVKINLKNRQAEKLSNKFNGTLLFWELTK